MNYLGDFSEDATVYIPFNTFSSDDPAASATITNLADADIKVHKDGSTTEIVTDGATVAIDFDGVTGNHLITVDTSAHVDYSTGSDYLVRIEGTTVDAGTVNAWVGSFSIENRHSAGALRPTTAGRTLDVTAGGTAGIDWGNVENPTTAVDLSGTDIQLCDTVTTNTDMRGTDGANTTTPPTAAAIADAVLDEALSGHATAGTLGKAVTDIEVDTADMQPKLGTPAADVSADIAAVKAETAAILADTGTDGVVVAGTPNVNVSQISGSATAADNLEASALGIVPAAVNDGAATTTAFIADGFTEATDDHFNGRIVVFTSGVLAGQATDITDYTGSTQTISCTALTEAPADNDTFVIV